MSAIYLLVGVPGSGKSWVASRLAMEFLYVPHDDYMDGAYGKMLDEVEGTYEQAAVAARIWVSSHSPVGVVGVIE